MSFKKSLLSAFAVALTATGLGLGGLGMQAQAQESGNQSQVPQASSLQELLDMVREGTRKERARMEQRIQEFRENQDQQEQRLAEAKQELADEEARSDRLEQQHSDNDIRIAELEKQLQERLGEFGELFGVTRQVAGDLRGIVEGSVTSAQYEGREKFLSEFAGMDELPEIDQIRELWFQLMQEMRASSEVAKFQTNVILASGEQVEREVVRVGAFNAVSNGQYLDYQADTGNLVELARQPAGRFLSMAQELQQATEGRHAFGIDPSRGSILSLLVQTPSWRERVDQGGFIGYLTIGLGVIGAILAIIQFIYLLIVGAKVRSQMKTDQANENNPLGRVLKVYEDNRSADVETLELKMDEAILRNTPPLERFLTIVKVLAVVAPLLGLLGTVTGMINTFQAITLFGTGDPKLMAGGISQALVTTMLGLTVAIPLTFLHTLVQGRSRAIIHILEEQAAGIVAVHAEKK